MKRSELPEKLKTTPLFEVVEGSGDHWPVNHDGVPYAFRTVDEEVKHWEFAKEALRRRRKKGLLKRIRKRLNALLKIKANP